MFVFSVKADRKTIRRFIGGVLVAVALLLVVTLSGEKSVQTMAGNTVEVTDNAGRRAFLMQFGWEVSQEPIEICEVIIPEVFDTVYQNYSDLQKSQDFDLTQYRGKRVKRWTYQVLNYPEAESTVVANLLVYNNRVIGGDISSRTLDGFMQGFSRDAKPQTLPQSSQAENG